MMQAMEWPNKLGFDVGEAEVFKHAEQFRVFTEELALLVPYSVTTDPVVAVMICERFGHSREMLEYEMDYLDAERKFREYIANQSMFNWMGNHEEWD
jgi:hypothetical protein